MSRGTQKGVWTLLMVITPLFGGVMSVRAQQSEPSEPSSASLQRVRSALQSPQHLISSGAPLIAPSKPDEVQLGALTFLAPDSPGQFVSIRAPAGALVSRATHAVVTAQRRRAANDARDEVAKALAEFQRAQPK